MRTKKRICAGCGIEFFTNSSKQIYCTPKCREKERHEREQSHRPDIAPEPKNKRKSQVAEINRLAREAGMSYGQYTAKIFIEKQRAESMREILPEEDSGM